MGPLGHSLAAVAAIAGAPAVALAWLLRKDWRAGLSERLGEFPSDVAPDPIWIHGASVGETLAAGRLIEALQGEGRSVVTSTTTATGREVARARRPRTPSGLAPLDHPWAAGRALDRVRPSMLVTLETELWPSWIRAAADRGIPVVMASARISDRSFPRYQAASRLLRGTLERLSAVGARSAEDAERFIELGVTPGRVSVSGDLKLEPLEEAPGIPDALSQMLGDNALWIGGSTHAGEEDAALHALGAAERAGHGLVLVLAPRHPDRWDEVAASLGKSGRRVVRRSRPEARPLEAGDVLLLDSLGELASLWPRASVAFVGGTLAPVGGHNVLEPVQAGRPVLFGPHTDNAREAAAHVLDAKAGIRVSDRESLATATLAALASADDWSARGVAGRRALEAHRGATARTLSLIERVRIEAAS
jgi:3-deoxy-D-manno-octulosonic-acid transferase